MLKRRIVALLIIIIGAGLLYLAYLPKFPFHLGLDLSGGSHLVYKADTKALPAGDVSSSMASLRDVIERRVNMFGVGEPIVQSSTSGGEQRLIVDLPGVTDLAKAVALIGQTPVLEFKTEAREGTPAYVAAKDAQKKIQEDLAAGKQPDQALVIAADGFYENTPLTGRYLKKASVTFQQGRGSGFQEPTVALAFTAEGQALFGKITSENIGKTVAIYLDGAPLSTPVVQSAITDGNAIITGNFTPQSARELVGRLNAGALPVPIELLSTQTVGATLGSAAVQDGMKAGLVGLILVAIFMVLWYRLPGVVAVVALAIYIGAMLSLFKLIPVTLTAAGIAGFILTIGMAVDANVLIFERTKEELKNGASLDHAIREGFHRAWPSIRDGNMTSIITSVILFFLSSSLIQGFALTLGIGILMSMLSAVVVTRTFMMALPLVDKPFVRKFLFGSGFFTSKVAGTVPTK